MHQVFLSSTARDLTAYRDAVTTAIHRLDGFHCVRMEDFGASDVQADDFIRARIAECDIAIFLLLPPSVLMKVPNIPFATPI